MYDEYPPGLLLRLENGRVVYLPSKVLRAHELEERYQPDGQDGKRVSRALDRSIMMWRVRNVIYARGLFDWEDGSFSEKFLEEGFIPEEVRNPPGRDRDVD